MEVHALNPMTWISVNSRITRVHGVTLSENSIIIITTTTLWAGKMAQQVEVLATKLEDLNSIPGINMEKGENHLKLPSDLHTHGT